ncbi:hypothetical protein RB653_008751 [Dictyostelium firmibasis]|uniref:Uncharacterized protein n=1 Tax=Dictyostelium firmibasis TaxID=79012 RepID=A0AAN7TZQ4_9MYCE
MNNQEVLKETIEYVSRSSKLLKIVSDITKEKIKEYPYLDDLTEQYIQAQHLYDRTPKLLKLLSEINITDAIISNESIENINNMKYELEHLIESTYFRINDIDTYFKRVESEYFLKDNKNEFYIELCSYNSQIQEGLKKLKSIYENGALLANEVSEINRKKFKNSDKVLTNYLNTGIALFIILISLLLYFMQLKPKQSHN